MILRGASPEWTPVDRILAVAHVMAQDLLCTGCGQPKHEAWNPDSEGYYEVQEAWCNGCAEAARDADAHKDKDQHDRKAWVVNERPANVQLRPWIPGQ